MNPFYALSPYRKTATIGGVLWLLYYLIDIGYGLLGDFSGYQVENSPALRLTGPAYFGGVVCVGITLIGLYPHLNGRYRALALPALLIAGTATLAATLGLSMVILSLAGISVPQEPLGVVGPSVLPLFMSAILLGIASRRVGSLPLKTANLMLIFGLTTFPLGITLWVILTDMMSSYWFDEFHFALAGTYWLMIGRALRQPEEVRQPVRYYA